MFMQYVWSNNVVVWGRNQMLLLFCRMLKVLVCSTELLLRVGPMAYRGSAIAVNAPLGVGFMHAT